MGLTNSRLLRRCLGFSECNTCRIMIFGIDGAGKTQILYRLKLGEVVTTIPTVGFNVETLVHNGTYLTYWDVGFNERAMHLYHHYLANVQGIVFVVNSSDPDRLEDAHTHLLHILSLNELNDLDLLVYANQQDRPGAVQLSRVADRLGLKHLKQRHWHIQGSSAITGAGLRDGLDWLHAGMLHRAPLCPCAPECCPGDYITQKDVCVFKEWHDNLPAPDSVYLPAGTSIEILEVRERELLAPCGRIESPSSGWIVLDSASVMGDELLVMLTCTASSSTFVSLFCTKLCGDEVLSLDVCKSDLQTLGEFRLKLSDSAGSNPGRMKILSPNGMPLSPSRDECLLVDVLGVWPQAMELEAGKA